jgi:hypothetical protein
MVYMNRCISTNLFRYVVIGSRIFAKFFGFDFAKPRASCNLTGHKFTVPGNRGDQPAMPTLTDFIASNFGYGNLRCVR